MDISSEFYKYFINVVSNMPVNNSRIHLINSTIQTHNLQTCNESIFMNPCDEYEVSCLVDELENRNHLVSKIFLVALLAKIKLFVSPIIAQIANLIF